MRCAILFMALALVHFVLDRLCLKLIGDGEVVLIRGVLGLRHIENTGAAFGLFSSSAALASIFSGALITLMLAFVLFGRMNLAARLCLTAALTGGACNLYMRIFYSAVNDWIELKFMDYPLFNFADICVCVGALLFAVFYLFTKDGAKDAS